MVVRIAVLTLLGLNIAFLSVAFLKAEDKNQHADRSKALIEMPAKAILGKTPEPKPKRPVLDGPVLDGPVLDVSKRKIERPAKAVLAKPRDASPKRPVDISKERIELPAKTLVGEPKPLVLDASKLPRVDVTKAVIEFPPKELLVELKLPAKSKPRVDESKADIEAAPKRVLVDTSKAKSAPADREFKKVAPGKVSWHMSFDAAVAASKKSSKPVLLFQLLGQLDEEFT